MAKKEEIVTVRIPIDKTNPDMKKVRVSVNGVTLEIQRGVDVLVPKQYRDELIRMEII